MSQHPKPNADGRVSTRELFSDDDGDDALRCPKCGSQLASMDAVVDHVHDAHDPLHEFAQRWGGPDE
jgi:uncharacterized C2H2 Zn-finger protein